MFKHTLLCGLLLAATATAGAQEFQMVSQTLDNPDNQPRPCFPVPNQRQLDWHEIEFYAFFHYGMNTFTGLEWGYGNETESTYAPQTIPNCKQWVQAAKDAGMRGGIAVVKHHDGFCLWPTGTTTHNVTRGSGVAAQVNIPKQFAAASEELGMRYGFYISPWDRNQATYGERAYVTEVFFKQVDEISREAGSNQFEMWFDGANGGNGYYGGKNTSVSIDNSIYYDRPNLYDHIHSLQPNCVVWGDAGEARWIGNEYGYGYETQWNNSNGGAYSGQIEGWRWWGVESDAKISNSGWFWHNGETLRSLDQLFKMYLETVGRGATFILNIAPNQDGVLPDASVTRLRELGDAIQARLGTDLALGKPVTVSETRTAGASRNYQGSNLTDGNKDTYWATNDGTLTAEITIDLESVQTLHYVALQEYIKLGQRVKDFTVQLSQDGESWNSVNFTCTTIGAKRIVCLGGSTSNHSANQKSARYVKVTINDSRACPLLHTISVF